MSLVEQSFIANDVSNQRLIVNVASDVRELRVPLRNLLSTGATPTSVFSSYEWLDAAARWQGTDVQPLLLVVTLDATVVGVAPLAVADVKHYGLTFRELRFLSVPDAQRCDIVSSDAYREHVVDAVAAFLCQRQAHWDVLRLTKLDSSSRIADELHQALSKRGLSARTYDCGANYGVDLRDDWPSYYSRRSRRLKKGNNLVHNRLHKRFARVEIVHHRQELSPGEALARLMTTLAGISGGSWKTDTGLTLDNAGPFRFIDALSAHAAANGWLSIWLLRLDGEPVAFEYQLVHNQSIYALRADYRSDYEDASPGTYLNWQILMRLFDSECRHYFMGPGANPYKARWAETEDTMLEVHAYGSGPKAQLLRAVNEKLKPLTRRTLNHLRKKTADGTHHD